MMPTIGLNGRRIRTLLWLRGKLTIRQFSREKGRIVGAILVILIFGPMIVGMAVGTAVGYQRMPDPWPAHLLGGVLVFIWLIWAFAPIFAGAANEAADITRLLVYPLPRRDLVVGILVGTLFDYPTYLIAPLFIAIFVGFGFNTALPVLILAVLLSYAHIVIIGQLITTALGGILQSRRFRDLIIIFASLFGASCYFFQALLNRLVPELLGNVNSAQVLALRPLNILQWLPTGATARAVEYALNRNWLLALGWLAYSILWLVLLTWAWWRLLVRVTTGEGFLLNLAPRPQAINGRKPQKGLELRLEWLPADIAQLMSKEWKSIWRIPQRRVGVLQGILMPFLMMGAILLNGDSTTITIPSWFGLSLPVYALFLFWVNGQNMIGLEGRGLFALLLTPIPRYRIFLAKGLALGVTSAVPLLLVGLIFFVLSKGSWLVLAAIPTGLSMGFAALGVTTVTSALFPIPINLESKKMRGSISSGGGCLTAFVNALVVPLLIAVVASPTAILLGLAYGWDQPSLAALNGIVAPIYAVVIFWFANRLAGNLLLEREAEVLATIRLPDDQ